MITTPASESLSKRSLESDEMMDTAQESMIEADRREEADSARKKVKREHASEHNLVVEVKKGEEMIVAVKDDEGEGLKWPERSEEALVTSKVGKGNNDHGGWGRLPRHLLQCVCIM